MFDDCRESMAYEEDEWIEEEAAVPWNVWQDYYLFIPYISKPISIKWIRMVKI